MTDQTTVDQKGDMFKLVVVLFLMSVVVLIMIGLIELSDIYYMIGNPLDIEFHNNFYQIH